MSSDEDFSPDRQKKRGCNRLRIADEELGASGSSTGDSAIGPSLLEMPRKKCRRIEEDDSESEGEEDCGLNDSGVNAGSENEGQSSDEEDDDEDDDDEQEDDSDNWEDINEDAEQACVDSDASDGQSEKCAICLNKFLGQEIGIPECCDHSFCLECLLEWTKKINTCPVDRQVFQLVLVRLELDGKVIRRVPVEAPEEEVATEEDPTYCEVCSRCDREDRLLLCDACDLAYHCECLDPPLETIPIEEWYCPNCSPPPSSAEEEMPEDLLDEFNELLESRFRPQTVRRAIARTRASETVRSRIQSRRTAQGSSSAVATSNGVPKTKRKVARKRTTRKKGVKRRKTSGKSKRKTTSGKKKKWGKRRAWRRKTKGRRRVAGRTRRAIQAARPLVCPTVKGRIAERLGLQKPPPGHTLPLMRQPGPIRNGYGSQDTGLLLFGDRDELHSFEMYEEDDHNAGGEISALRATPAHRHAPHKSKAVVCRPDILTRTTSSVPYPSSFDLLGSILQTQTILHTNNVKVKIGRDGSLTRSTSDKTLQCPLGPPAGTASESPHLSDRTNAKSHQQPSASSVSHPAAETGNCSENDVSHVGGGDAETAVSPSNDNDHCSPSNDDHKRPHRSPQPPSKQHHSGKETKSGTSDDDIDIYSDIESISNDTNEDMYVGETMGAVLSRCDPGSPVDHPMADSSEDELVIDEEAAHPESEPEEATKNGLATPEEEDMDEELEEADVHEAAASIESPDEEEYDVDLSVMKIEEGTPVEDECDDDSQPVKTETEERTTPVKDEIECDDDSLPEKNETGEETPVEDECDDDSLPVKNELDNNDEEDDPVRDVATPVIDEDFEIKADMEQCHREKNVVDSTALTETESQERFDSPVVETVKPEPTEAKVVKLEQESIDEEDQESTITPSVVPHGPDEDDVICAKVGSPISETEDPADHHSSEMVKAQQAATSEEVPKAPEEETETVADPVQTEPELPEDGEIPTEEVLEDQPEAEDVEEEDMTSHCFSNKLEGVEDVSEAGSDDNQMDDDDKDEEEDEEEDGEVDHQPEDQTEIEEEVERKVAQLFSDESKQLQSEEDEGLCESGNSQEAHEMVAPPVQKTHHRHHRSPPEEPSRSRSHRSSKDRSSDSKRLDPNAEISWKKLSKSSKERSYRDGKPRDDRILYRERELKDRGGGEERSRNKREEGGGGGGCRHSRSKEEERNSRYEDNRHDKRSSSNKSNKHKDKYEDKYETGGKYEKRSSHRSSTEYAEWQQHDKKYYDKYEEKRPTSDARETGRHGRDKTQSTSKYKHKDYKYDQYGSKYEVESDKHYKYEQQAIAMQVAEEVPEKHGRRDREKHKDREVRKVENKLIVEKKSGHEKKKSSGGNSSQPKKKKRTPSPISDISDVESKEIYSKGGSIIINVNYNRSKETGKQQHSASDKTSRPNNEDDSWAAAGGDGNKSDDDIQILCEKPVERSKRLGPLKHRKKKENLEVTPKQKKKKNPDPSFDMFWRDVEDISQDNKLEEHEEKHVLEQKEDIQNVATPSEDKVSSPSPSKKSPILTPDKTTSDTLTFSGIFKKQPRSPSPPSPSDNESYDPCDPTRSPSPKPEPQPKKETVHESRMEPVRDVKPKPPPEPILPPLPPEPEPPRQPSPPPPSKSNLESPIHNSSAMPNTFPSTPTSAQFPNSMVIQNSPMSMPNIRIPPPNFMPQPIPRNPGALVASGIQTLRWPMANGPPPMLFQASQMQHMIRGNFMAAQLVQGGLQPPQLSGMMPPHAANHLAMLRPQLGGPTMIPNPVVPTGGPMQPMLLPDLSHPPPQLVMQTQLPFSAASVTVNNNTLTSVPLMVPLLTTQHPMPKPEPVIKEKGSDLVVDMEVESPYSPADSPPADDDGGSPEPVVEKRPTTPPKEKDRFDALLAAVPRLLADKRTRELLTVLRPRTAKVPKVVLEKKGAMSKGDLRTKHRHGKPVGKRKGIAVKMRESQLKILDELPSSAVEMQVKEKFLKKLNRQERVVEEVKHALKPFYNKRDIDKLEYKTILRKCVPKICHNKTGEINPVKIKGMVEGYVRKYKHHRKKKGDS